MTTKNDPLVGTTYDGRYKIERRIGVGGMANVYLAQDDTLGRSVAIKVLHQRYAEDSQFIERFLREASAAARLNHPNIVQVYDRGHAADTYYIAMEFVDGMTLKELVTRRGALTEQETLAYGRQGLHALRFAHRNGIVHRDIKPHNMMVDTDGRLKIADFGIARAGADSGLTEAGSIVGTAQYLSPEQAQGHDVSATSDLYSLGVVMFEMSTGRVPFDGDSPVNVALRHVQDAPPRPSSLKSGMSAQLESIILKAMEKDPSRRYATADEMLADLDRARDGGETAAMTQVLGVAAVGSAAGTTQVTPITAAPVSSGVYNQPIAPEPAWPETGWEDDDHDKKGSALRWIIPLLILLLVAVAAAWVLMRATGDPVPDVTGKTLIAATTLIEDAGFVVGSTEEEFSETEKAGTVISQSPDGGDDAKLGSEIDLVLSEGAAPIEIPDVTGLPMGKAIEELEAAGFVVRQSARKADPEIKAGFVISQTPGGGDELAKGGTVTLTLSSGPEEQSIPNVVGTPLDEATKLLEGKPYELVVSERSVDSSQPKGTVVAQSTAAGGELAPGSKITLDVASGSNVVPEVAGLGRDDAVDALEKAGFDTEVVTEGTEDPAKVGVVLSTDPSAEQRREVGSTIQVNVGEALGNSGEGGTPPGAQ